MEQNVDKQRCEAREVKKRIAVVTLGVKLADEVRGYTRFRKIAQLLVEAGFEVDLVTSSFQHWDKAHRDVTREVYSQLPYRVVFIDEPGYSRNLDLKRIASHRVAAKNLEAHFQANRGRYSLIYSEIPPNDMALCCARFAQEEGIPYVADINDLWPEAMRMAIDVPVLSDIAFFPFARDAKKVYRLLDAAVGTSDEYAARPGLDRSEPYRHITVYVGNDLAAFDEGAARFAEEVCAFALSIVHQRVGGRIFYRRIDASRLSPVDRVETYRVVHLLIVQPYCFLQRVHGGGIGYYHSIVHCIIGMTRCSSAQLIGHTRARHHKHDDR